MSVSPVYTDGMPASHSALKHAPGVLVRLDDHRDVAGPHGLAVERGAAGEQRADVGGEVGADVLAQVVDRDVLGCPCGPDVCRCTTRSRNGSSCGAPASRRPWWCASTSCTTIVGVAELGAAQHRLQPSTARLSLRQLVPSVFLAPAVSAASGR